jgi:predicted kinase
VADVAFLVMELEFVDRPELASGLAQRYLTAAGDPEGAELLPYYTTYRDVVRGKVRSLQAEDERLGGKARENAAAKATRHFLRGLGRLSPPADRPALVIVGGLPGVGKSTVARGLEATCGFRWIGTDRVRKELAATPGAGAERLGEAAVSTAYGGGIYSGEWNERTYAECERRARDVLLDGGRVVVDGSFRRDRHRTRFIEAASRLGVPVVFLHGLLEPAEARRRLASRPPGPSDADWRIHERMAHDWDAPSPLSAPHIRELRLEGAAAEALHRATAILALESLA